VNWITFAHFSGLSRQLRTNYIADKTLSNPDISKKSCTIRSERVAEALEQLITLDPYNKMKIKGPKPNIAEPIRDQPSRVFQPAALITAELLFAVLLLYLTKQPVELSPSQANPEPAIIIDLPTSNVAIASTFIEDLEKPEARN